MKIISSPRPDKNYTVLPNLVFNSNLSYRAIGLMAFLLSKPRHWKFSISQLIEAVAESESADKRDAIYSILKELVHAGLVSWDWERGHDGRFKSSRYFIDEGLRYEL